MKNETKTMERRRMIIGFAFIIIGFMLLGVVSGAMKTEYENVYVIGNGKINEDLEKTRNVKAENGQKTTQKGILQTIIGKIGLTFAGLKSKITGFAMQEGFWTEKKGMDKLIPFEKIDKIPVMPEIKGIAVEIENVNAGSVDWGVEVQSDVQDTSDWQVVGNQVVFDESGNPVDWEDLE